MRLKPQRDPPTTSDDHGASQGMTLEFTGSRAVDGNRGNIWPKLQDPGFLAQCVPGAESVECVDERRFRLELSRGLSHLEISPSAEVTILESEKPEWMLVEGSGYEAKTHTEFRGTAILEMNCLEGDRVGLAYQAELSFVGGARLVTPKILRPIIKSDVDQYFTNVKNQFKGDRPEESFVRNEKDHSGG